MIIIAVMGVLGLETIIDSSFVDSLVCPLSPLSASPSPARPISLTPFPSPPFLLLPLPLLGSLIFSDPLVHSPDRISTTPLLPILFPYHSPVRSGSCGTQ